MSSAGQQKRFVNRSFYFRSQAYPAKLDEGLTDEDEGNEEGEDLLGEAGDEADQEASLKGHRDDHDDDEPEPDPDAARQVLHLVRFAELSGQRPKKLNSSTGKCSE